jgi:hypothetical protein
MTNPKTYAKCPDCHQEMAPGGACTFDRNGERIRWGSETRFGEVELREHDCHDCNVAWGELHHPGCDMEECPTCHHQAISCDCGSPGVAW